MALKVYCTKMWYSSVHAQVVSKVPGFFSELRQVAWSWSLFSRLEDFSNFPIWGSEAFRKKACDDLYTSYQMKGCLTMHPHKEVAMLSKPSASQNTPPSFILRCNWVQITVLIPNSLESHGKCRLIMNVSSDYKLTVILRGHSERFCCQMLLMSNEVWM
jgi:hypothetical protein